MEERFIRRYIWLLSGLLPSLAITGLIFGYPIYETYVYSFERFYLIQGNPQFDGLANYAALLASRDFFNSLVRTAIYGGLGVTIATVMGLGAAQLLSAPFKGARIVRSFIIIPWLFPEPLAGLIWAYIFNPFFGLFNAVLRTLGLIGLNERVALTVRVDTVLYLAILILIWRLLPFMTILLLAGLQGIPASIYEASMIDGASEARKFWHITLPMLKPVLTIAILFSVLSSINVFDLIWTFTAGGPAGASETVTINIYKTTFYTGVNVGFASASAVFLSIIGLTFTYAYFRLIRRHST